MGIVGLVGESTMTGGLSGVEGVTGIDGFEIGTMGDDGGDVPGGIYPVVGKPPGSFGGTYGLPGGPEPTGYPFPGTDPIGMYPGAVMQPAMSRTTAAGNMRTGSFVKQRMPYLDAGEYSRVGFRRMLRSLNS